jgi:hypothetical protein
MQGTSKLRLVEEIDSVATLFRHPIATATCYCWHLRIPQCLIKHQTMKAYRGVCTASPFLPSALHKGELSALRPRRFSPRMHWTLVGRTAGLGVLVKTNVPCPCLENTCTKICRSALYRVLILSANYPLLPPSLIGRARERLGGRR